MKNNYFVKVYQNVKKNMYNNEKIIINKSQITR